MIRLLTVAILAAAVSTGCNALSASDVEKDVLTGGQIACILLNATTDAKAVAQACNIADNLIPVIQSTLAAHRQGIGVARNGCAAPDAGK